MSEPSIPKISAAATSTVQVAPDFELVYTPNSAQLVNSNGVQVWAVSPTLFAPAAAGTAPVVSVVVTVTKHTIHPPPPPRNGNPEKFIAPEATTVTDTTITITVSGARFAGTNVVADCSLVITQIVSSDDPTTDFPRVTYSQTFGGYSFPEQEVEDFLGYVTVHAAIPAGTLNLPEGTTGSLSAGLVASIDLAPGLMRFYSGANGAAVVAINSPQAGELSATLFSLAATQGSVALAFPAPAPPFQTAFTFQEQSGWTFPPPAAATAIGTLGAGTGPNFDTASILAGEDAAANLSFVGLMQLRLAANAATAVQYTLSLAAGLTLLGDATAAPVVVSLVGCQLNLSFVGQSENLALAGSFALGAAPLTTGSLALWPATGNIAGGFSSIDFSVTPAAVSGAFLNLAQALCSLPDAVTRPLPWSATTGVALITGPPPLQPAYASYVVLGAIAATATRAFLAGISLEVARPVDMAIAAFSFENCGVLQSGSGQLQLAAWYASPAPAQPAFMTVLLPPQHISENAFPLNDDNTPQGTLGPPPVTTRMAASTSLLMQLPAAVQRPLSAATLFDWSSNVLLSAASGAIAAPNPQFVSVIELPYRLLLALDTLAGWVQQPAPDAAAATSTLWHARLGFLETRSDGTGFVNERSNLQKTARATYTYDSAGASGSAFANEALTAANREDIVFETEQFATPGTAIAVDHLILSPLGAWADLRSLWPGGTPPTGHSLVAWTHILSQGRDQYVRAVTVGFLLPWGHAASLIEVAERRFSGDAGNTAYLSTKRYIVVGEVTRTYLTQPSGAPMLRDAVLTQVDLLTQITPALDQSTGAITVPGDTTGPAFWPYVDSVANGNQPFLFHARVYDGDQLASPPRKSAETYLAAIFVDASASQNLITAALNAFNAGSAAASAHAEPHANVATANALVPGQVSTLTTAALNGQQLALATTKTLGDTTHAINSLSMQVASLVPAGAPWNLGATIPNFYPSLKQASVNLPAVGLLTTSDATNVVVSHLPAYLNPNTDGTNPVDAYMGLANPVTAVLSGAKANGLVAPALAISGLSRTFGALVGDAGSPASALQGLLAGNLNPQTFFPSNAKLLNLIPFSDLIGAATNLTSFDTSHIPQVQIDSSDPTKLVAKMNWLPTISWPPPPSTDGTPAPTTRNTWNAPGGFVSLVLNGDLTKSITLSTTVTTPVTPGPLPGPVPAPIPAGAPVSTMVAIVNDFTLNVLGLVAINFATLTFTSTTGKKPSVEVGLASKPFVLTGQIDFLQVLFDAIETLFDTGPKIDVDDAAITLSFEFAVPDIGMGIFDLSGIAIGVSVVLSLGTDPVEFHFHYAGPENPFDLAVDLLGGGGYFTVDSSDRNSTSIKLAAQAGASVSLDLGVASGSVSIMLGAFFQSSSADGDGALLGGYVRADGQLNVLDIITLHVSFYLGVTYAPEAGILWGECTVTVEVSVLFFHQSVSLSMRKQFPVKLPSLSLSHSVVQHDVVRAALAPAWPIPRDQIMSAADWTTYVGAFV